MKLSIPPATAVGLIALVLISACGQGQPASSETPSQIWHELVACARSHGDPSLPDPVIDSQGRAKFPPGTQPPSQATMQACQSIYNRLPAAARSSGPSSADIQMEIKFAQCMRSHGLSDWPDPDANGAYPLPPDLITQKTGPVWERIKAAWDACKAFNPSGSINVSHS
jgi:hypothetical protein